jgi:hypothetical protein
MRRALGLLAFLPLASRAPSYTRLLWALVRDERTPGGRKALLAAALGYLVVGKDLMPDDVPLLGGLDDLVVLVLAVDRDRAPGLRARHRAGPAPDPRPGAAPAATRSGGGGVGGSCPRVERRGAAHPDMDQ